MAPLDARAHLDLRADLAAAFRWAVRNDWHEGVANHFSVVTDDTRFLLNPQKHFARIRASDLLELDAAVRPTLSGPDAPDATAWGLHGSVHRNVPHAKAALHVHSHYATALASLADSTLPPVDQNSAMFFGKVVVDGDYGGLAFESEGERVCGLLADPKVRILVMGNHGVMAVGETVAEAYAWLYYFERACRNYITALSTGRPLRMMDERVAAKVAAQTADVGGAARLLLSELRAILDEEGSDYAT